MKWKKIILYIIVIVVYAGLLYVLINASCGNKKDKSIKTTEEGIVYNTNGYILDYVGESKELVIPEELNGTKIIGLNNNALSEIHFDKLEIPKTIKEFKYDFSKSKINVFHYNGTLKNWCNIEFKDSCYNPMINIDDFYIKDNDGQYISLDTTLALPNGVEEIKRYQFLLDFNDIYLPSSLTKIYANAFGKRKFNSFESIYFKGSIEDWCNVIIEDDQTLSANLFYIYSNEKYELIKKVVIPGSVSKINDFQFCGMKSIEDIVIEDGVKNIGVYSFGNLKEIKSLSLADSIEVIDGVAFDSPSSYKLSHLPENLRKIDAYSFKENVLDLIEHDNGYYFGSKSNPYLVYAGYKEEQSKLIINENARIICGSLLGTPVIGSTIINELVIPSTITYINGFDLTSANNLEIKKIYYNGNIKDWCQIEIDNNFDSQITIDNLYITNSNGIELLKNIVVPKEVSKIGDNQFLGTRLETISIEDGVTSIGNKAFYNCKSLIEVTIPNSVCSIGDKAFSKCDNLKRVYLPSHLKEFESEFRNDGNCEIEFIYS